MFLLNLFIFIGIIASAISGALMGVRKQFDFFGIIVLGIATALGGGIIRDILIGYTPPVAFRQPVYVLAATVAALFVMFFPRTFGSRPNAILFFDAIGLAVFTAVGANIALQQEISSTFIAVTIGVITGVGGGILRDMLSQEIPLIFKKEVYATASAAGALSLAFVRHIVDGMTPLYVCFSVTLAIRLAAVYFGIHTPSRDIGNAAAQDKQIFTNK